MSLVDYASSSDEDETKKLEQPKRINHASSLQELNKKAASSSSKQLKSVCSPSESSELKLPDASFLLNSPVPSNGLDASDHSSRVAAAMAQSAARKRELNMLPVDNPRSKFPKGSLAHSKNVPNTLGGRLLPPQLVGRSNVVTEDISKLFVRRSTNSST